MMDHLEDDKKKLWTATRNLDKLKRLLNVSTNSSNKMCEILTHFDERLSKLEETVQPVYKETNNLQRQQSAIVDALTQLDYVIKFYTVAGEVEPSIISGPSATTLEHYLRDLDRLKEAANYFQAQNPDSPEMMNVHSLLEKGATTVEYEFRSLLSRHSSAPMPVHQILELINSASDSSSSGGGSGADTVSVKSSSTSNSVGATTLQKRGSSDGGGESAEKTQAEASARIIEKRLPHVIQLLDKNRNDLRLLSDWLCKTRDEHFVTLHATIRSSVLYKSLENLRNYLKSSSLGTMINNTSATQLAGLRISPLLGGRRNLHLVKPTLHLDGISSSSSTTSSNTGGGNSGRRTSFFGGGSGGGTSDSGGGGGGNTGTLGRQGFMKRLTDAVGGGGSGSGGSGGGTPKSGATSGDHTGGGGGGGGSSGDGNGINTMAPDYDAEPLTEREIISYVTTVTGAFKLMQIEQNFVEQIIPSEKYQKKIFSRIVIRSLESIHHEGESLSTRVKRCLQHRQDFTSALCLLPVLRYHSHMRHSFDLLFDGCEMDVQTKLHSLVVTLQTTISKSLEEFIEHIKASDREHHSKVPKDGTVHELTSNVMLFLVHLHSYLDILSRVITVTDIRSLESCSDKNRITYAQYIYRVLSALALALSRKAEQYNYDQTLKAIFILNNNYYILKTLRNNSLLNIVRLYKQDQVEQDYEQVIADQKRKYRRSWDRLLEHLLETRDSSYPISQQRAIMSPTYSTSSPHHPHHQTLPNSHSAYTLSSTASASFRLKDKDRQAIKDKFAGFNKEFESLYTTQKVYAIPDAELRDELKQENVQMVVPKYNLFYDKYVQMDFTKNVHKYIKYAPDHVAQKIMTFFDSAA